SIWFLLFACFLVLYGWAVWRATHQSAEYYIRYNRSAEVEQKREHYQIWEWGHADPGVTFFTFWLVIVGGVQASLFVWQLLLIRESLEDTRIAANAAKQAADAATQQARAAERTLETMQDTARRELRAYLESGVGDLDVNLQNETVRFGFFTINHGQTPATSVKHYCTIAVEEHPLPDNFEFDKIEEEDATSSPVIFPSQKRPIDAAPAKITKVQLDEILSGKKRLYVRSLTRYMDVFAQKRETSMCLSLSGAELNR